VKLRAEYVAPFISGLYTLWCRTLRYSQVNREPSDALSDAGKLMVFALWHDEVFAFPYIRGNWRIFSIVSRSNDGEFIAKLLEGQNIRPLRGSSSRGGLAVLLRGAKVMREENLHACIAVDGPRGPRHKAKDGAQYLAHRANAYIVPMRAVYHRAKVFGSWDKFRLPLPFSRVTAIFGEPYLMADEKLTDAMLARERRILEAKLEALSPSGEKA
jgi:lysophospholipid acyltransferase (LPLAT)-like uncharacterized protein